MEAAVAEHFSRQTNGAGPSESAPARPVAALRAVVGAEPSEAQLAELLRVAGGSVDAAADLFFSNGLPESEDAPEEPLPRYSSLLYWLLGVIPWQECCMIGNVQSSLSLAGL